MRQKILAVLVVDDEPAIVEVIKSYLENSGYMVKTAGNGKDALDIFNKIQPCLVILDLMLPDVSGEEVCRQIRKQSRIPVIMLTARAGEEDILEGLGLGADDYITKPFIPRQLVARVNAVLRRTEHELVPLADLLKFNDDLEIDNLKHEVCKNSKVVNLTPNEYRILMTLIKYPNKTFTREELIDLAFDEDYSGYSRTIDTHIKNLRQKIETDAGNPCYILTIHGIGYRFGGGK